MLSTTTVLAAKALADTTDPAPAPPARKPARNRRHDCYKRTPAAIRRQIAEATSGISARPQA